MDARQSRLLVALCTLLCAVYLLTYSGRIESGDTLALFDAASSLVHFQDNLYDQSASVNPPPTGADDRLYPLLSAAVEPLHSLLAAGLVGAADRLPGVGLVHAAWLLNVFVSAAAVGTLYLYALALGYGTLAAVLAALAFGLATMLWPYSKTFFREPLALEMILLSALLLERWRGSRYRSLPLLAGSAAAVAGAFLSKEAVVFAVPALVLVVMPGWEKPPRWFARAFRVVLALLLLALLGLIVTSAAAGAINFQPGYAFAGRLLGRPTPEIEAMHAALHTYLLSIGGSIWATSPVVLLALPGMWLLYRRGQYRYIAVAVAAVPAFAIGYAALRGEHWFGGLSWPPRFLLPAVPFLMLAALPVIDRLTRRPVRPWLVAGAGMLVVYGLWVQFSGVTLPWGAYTAALPRESGGLSEWGGGLNLVRYLRWVVIPPLWADTPLDFAWVRASQPLWPALFAALAVFCAWQTAALLRRTRAEPLPFARLRLWLMPVALLAAVGVGLRLIDADPWYMPPQKDALFQAVQALEQESIPGDVLLLSSDTYENFFLNHGRPRPPRVISLPDQPGEQPSPEQPAQIVSDNPDALLTRETISLIYNLAGRRSRLWLLADSGPWLAWSVRPVERFLSAHYYPVRVIEFAPTVRVIEYNITSAPDAYAFRGADSPAAVVYGEQVRLVGFTLPLGETYRPGDVLPVSLYWQAEKPPERDYTVALFLAGQDAAGTPLVQGTDSPPGGGFEATSRWRPGVPVWDNRALSLPADLPPGQYQLWLRLYYWDGEARPLVVRGDRSDDTTGILPVTIEIRSYG